MNRRSVDTYRQYQDECIELAEKINGAFKCPEAPEWKPLIFQTDGMLRQIISLSSVIIINWRVVWRKLKERFMASGRVPTRLQVNR